MVAAAIYSNKKWLTKAMKWIFFFILYYPLLYIIFLVSFYIRVVIAIGDFPPDDTSPKAYKFYIHHSIVYYSGDLMTLTFIITVLSCIKFSFTYKSHTSIQPFFYHSYISLGLYLIIIKMLVDGIAGWFHG